MGGKQQSSVTDVGWGFTDVGTDSITSVTDANRGFTDVGTDVQPTFSRHVADI